MDMNHSAMLGEFWRAEGPLTVKHLMEVYGLSRPRVNAELSLMLSDGHIEVSPDGLSYSITEAGREAWTTVDDDE